MSGEYQFADAGEANALALKACPFEYQLFTTSTYSLIWNTKGKQKRTYHSRRTRLTTHRYWHHFQLYQRQLDDSFLRDLWFA